MLGRRGQHYIFFDSEHMLDQAPLLAALHPVRKTATSPLPRANVVLRMSAAQALEA